ncbi:NAD(+)/NADH kinase [Candidatus Woesearchaeota archaeon]|nr:NAD(+)/NADH kinase [Candidatus Woesearchaeota archaeon]
MKKIRKALVVYYPKHYGTLTKLKKALRENRITAYYKNREREAEIKKLAGKADAVIAVGGDGTLLRTSHFVESQPTLLVTSSTNINEAFFSRATGMDIAKKARLLARGKYKLLPLLRLEITLNGKKLPFKALNEIYAGSKEPYHTARYTLIIGKRREGQKSSGIIISTPAGSYAWARSAGGKTLPLTTRKIQYTVREPYIGRLTKPRMLQGIINADQKITLISNIWERHKGMAVIDSYKKEFGFNKGAKLVVKAARKPLNLIYF